MTMTNLQAFPSSAKRRPAAALLGGVLICALLAGCSGRANQPEFDGQRYNSKVAAGGKDSPEFEITVKGTRKGLHGAREAGRYAGVHYCVATFGNPDIDWTNGPDAADDTLVYDKRGNLVLSGECHGWR